MGDLLRDGQALSYRTLLAVAEAIVSHRDLQALFHDLAGRLQQVVRFDYLALLLHEAASDMLRGCTCWKARNRSRPSPRPFFLSKVTPWNWSCRLRNR
jgi:hypothetical protein